MKSTITSLALFTLACLCACTSKETALKSPPCDVKKIKQMAYDSAIIDILNCNVPKDFAINDKGNTHYTGEAHYHNNEEKNLIPTGKPKPDTVKTGTLKISELNHNPDVIGYMPFINNLKTNFDHNPGHQNDPKHKHLSTVRVFIMPLNKKGEPIVTSKRDTLRIQVAYDIKNNPHR
jgi:hypothetical protein